MSLRQRGGIILRLMGLLVFSLFLVAGYAIRHPLLRLAGRAWIVADPLEHADAIVVLGDDNFNGDRAAHAAELFRAGWAPKVVASGRRVRPYAAMADLIEQDLDQDGVPPGAVVRFPHQADDTIEEAEALRQFAAENNWRRLIVVTSNYHTRRARYIFHKLFPASDRIWVSPAADSEFDADSWWTSHQGQRLFVHELFGYGDALWELRGNRATQPSS